MGDPLKLLLDTCSFIWLCSAPTKLGAQATQALDASENTRYLSLATVWEIVIKNQSGKLPLPQTPRAWIENQADQQDIEFLELDRRVIYQSGLLENDHRDPFDRWLAAEALHHQMTLVSPDLPFRNFGCATVW